MERSHLLLHDDSISTRLVSYILYLPNSPTDAPSSSAVPPDTVSQRVFLQGMGPRVGRIA